MRALIVGGGTGGHVIPAVAIAEALRERYGAECLFVGTPRGMEVKLVPRAGFELRLIEVGQLKSVRARQRATTLFGLPLALVECLRIVAKWKPDVAISVGGYASGPGALAAALRRVPLLAFEPNYAAGLANRAMKKFAAAAAVQFAETGRGFRNARVTGVPIRAGFFAVKPRAAGAAPTVLVFGGSQGARAINEAMIGAFLGLRERVPELHIVHQTGERDFERVRDAYAQLAAGRVEAARWEALAFIDDMPRRFAEADLIVCRAGASTVAEVAASGRAAVFIPLPTAADDHQTKNAGAMVEAGAAEMMKQAEMNPRALAERIARLLGEENRGRLISMGERARTLAKPDAAAKIAAMAAELAGVR